MDYDDNRYDDEDEEEEGEPLPPKVEELAQASVPTTLKGVRACMRCGIIKTLDQFLEYGCENCPFLDMVSDHCFSVGLLGTEKSCHDLNIIYVFKSCFLSTGLQAGNHDLCNLCTTAFFEGQVAVMDPGESWAVSNVLFYFDVKIYLCIYESLLIAAVPLLEPPLPRNKTTMGL